MKTIAIIIRCIFFVWLGLVILILMAMADLLFGPPPEPVISGWNGNSFVYTGADRHSYEKTPDGHFVRMTR